MFLPDFSRRFLIGLVLAASLPCAILAAPASVIIYHDGKLLTADAAGGVTELPFSSAGGENIDQVGTTEPVSSPDGRYIAFTRENDLWIYDVKTKETFRASRLGREADASFAAVYVLVTAWSPDSSSVLYHLSHGDAADPDGLAAEKEIRNASYGYRIYDIRKRTSEPVALAGEYKAWLPDGRFILTSQEKEFIQQFLLTQEPDDDLPKRLLNARGQWAQVDAARDGKFLVASLAQPFESKPGQMEDETELSSRIVRITVRNAKMSDVTPRGTWSEYQAPRVSPNGKLVAWVRQAEPNNDGFTRATLFAEGKEVAGFDGSISYRWIDDRSFVVSHGGGLDVISLDGRRLGGVATDVAKDILPEQ